MYSVFLDSPEELRGGLFCLGDSGHISGTGGVGRDNDSNALSGECGDDGDL